MLLLLLLLAPFGFGIVFEFNTSQALYNHPNSTSRCVPANNGHAFAVGGNLFLPNLEVDGDWELIFAGNSTLWLGASDCPAETSIGTPTWTSWWDPSAWTVSDGQQPPLHSNMVPGRFDVAIFPPQATYKVNISLAPTIAGLLFGGKEQTNETFHQYLRAAEAALQFTGTSLFVVQSTCRTRNGCPDENSEPAKMNEICKHVQCGKTPPCTDSFKPAGHCCRLCGATFKFSCQGETINVLDMQRDAMESRYLCPDGIFHYAISRIYNGSFCQVVVAWQKTDGGFDGSAALSCLRHIKGRYQLEDTTDLVVSSERAAVNYVLLLCLSASFLLLSLVVWQYTSLKERLLEQIIRFRILCSGERDDRVHFELTEPTERNFENLTYLHMLQRENIESEELLKAAAEFYRIKTESVGEER